MHGTVLRCLLGLGLVFGAVGIGRCDPLMTKSPDQERPDPAHVAGLIRQLGAEDFFDREAAGNALEAMGEPIMEELRQVSVSDPDLEIRHRTTVLVEKIEVQIGLIKGPASSEELIGHLRESKYPSYREWAAQQLAGVNEASRPGAVEALVAACKSDTAANVRLACIRSLGRLKMGTPAVLETLKGLKKDADPSVRDVATRVYAALPAQLPGYTPTPPAQPATGPAPADPPPPAPR